MRVFISIFLICLSSHTYAFKIEYLKEQCEAYVRLQPNIDSGLSDSDMIEMFDAQYCIGFMHGILSQRFFNCRLLNDGAIDGFFSGEESKSILSQLIASSEGMADYSNNQLIKMFVNWANDNPSIWNDSFVDHSHKFFEVCDSNQ